MVGKREREANLGRTSQGPSRPTEEGCEPLTSAVPLSASDQLETCSVCHRQSKRGAVQRAHGKLRRSRTTTSALVRVRLALGQARWAGAAALDGRSWTGVAPSPPQTHTRRPGTRLKTLRLQPAVPCASYHPRMPPPPLCVPAAFILPLPL